MIAAILLGLHACAGVLAFVWRTRKDGWKEGLLAVAFVGVIFSVGWTLATMIVSPFVDPEGLAEWFDRDALCLTLVTVLEGVFYALFLRSDAKRATEA